MIEINVKDRKSGKLFQEKVFGSQVLAFLYGNGFLQTALGSPLAHILSRTPLFSNWMGYWYKRPKSRHNIRPFIQKFGMDSSEFLENVDSFSSFNDFFIRKLKPSARPIASSDLVMPADARYLFYPHIAEADGFIVKGKKFSLEKLLQDKELAARYENGSMLIARLCPTDYHRFHFPCDCFASESRLINGYLYSVNPIALKKNLDFLTQNKRYITMLQTVHMGKIAYIEIGATSVGSVVQTYTPNSNQAKGAEKGYFEFGASCLILLFEHGKIQFDQDLVSSPHQEIYCTMGDSLGNTFPS